MIRLSIQHLLTAIVAAMLVTACSPKIYVVDRQTVLEDEAAGEWPQFEKGLVEKTAVRGPMPYPPSESTSEITQKSRLYSILNGPLVVGANEAPKAQATGTSAGTLKTSPASPKTSVVKPQPGAK